MTLANAVNVTGNVTLAGLTFGPQGLSTPDTVTITGAPTITVTSPVTVADQVSGTLVKAGQDADPTAAANNLAVRRRSAAARWWARRPTSPRRWRFQQRNATYNQRSLTPRSGGQRQRLADCGGICCAGRQPSNTYTGATTINSGAALQIGSGGTAGSINGASNVTDNGTLAIDLSN